MMPPHFSGGDDDDSPLLENVFALSGYSLNFDDFTVVDAGSGEACQVDAQVTEERIVASRWKDVDVLPPGAVQYRCEARIRFWPAVPGQSYRCMSMAGDVLREYRGPEIGADGSAL